MASDATDGTPDSVPRWFRDALDEPGRPGTALVQGCPVNYLQWGDHGAPGLVLVHGGGGHAHWWSFLAPMLARDYHVVALDLSGHGDSGRRDDYPRETWATEVLAVAVHARIRGEPVIVGHSMGGFVAIVTAALHPDAVAGVILSETPVRRPDPESEERRLKVNPLAMPLVYGTRERALDRFRLVPPQPCDNEFVVHHVAANSVVEVEDGWTWKFDPLVYRHGFLRGMHEWLPRVRCRHAMLRGEHSTSVTPAVRDYMYELSGRRAPVVEIPSAYHHVVLDQPIAVVSAIRALLADWDHSVPAVPRRD